jgi:molecular chaperone GrpE
MEKNKKRHKMEETEMKAKMNEETTAESVVKQSAEKETQKKAQESFADETQNEANTEEQLCAALADAEEKLAAEHDRYLRQLAEFENYRKRTLKEKSELILNGSASLMTAMLPVLDDMDRALDALTQTEDTAAWCEGFRLIAIKFRNTLEQNGMKQIETVNQPFDTDLHEAVAMMPVADESQKGRIVDCVQEGYMLNDKVLRHAKVVVSE